MSIVIENYSYEVVSGAELAERFICGEISVWALNRPINQDIVNTLYDVNEKSNIFLPAPITICIFEGKLLLVDGQHRVSVLERIHKERGILTSGKISIFVCFVKCDKVEEIKQCFCNINSGTPVPASYIDDIVANTIKHYIAILSATFPQYVSIADAPKRPYFSEQKIHRELSSFSGIKEGILEGKINAKILFDQTILVNQNRKRQYSDKTEDELDKQFNITKSMMGLIRKKGDNGFYCGLSKEWISEVAAGIKIEIARLE